MKKAFTGKKLLSLLMALALAVSLLPAMTQTASATTWYTGGTGTEEDPYIISSYEGLEGLAQVVSNGNNLASNYIQLADNFPTGGTATALTTPIGKDQKEFKGVFNGNGKNVVLNIAIVSDEAIFAGLFGVAKGATILNVSTSGTVSSETTLAMRGSWASGIAASATDGSKILNCASTCTVTAAGLDLYCTGAGGIVGYCQGATVENCYFAGTATGTYCGGIGASAAYCTIVKTYYLAPGAGVTYTCTEGTALSAAQMQAATGETDESWVEFSDLGKTALCDAMNSNVNAHYGDEDLLNWGVMGDGEYPVLGVDGVVLKDGKAYRDSDCEDEVALPNGITYDAPGKTYTFKNVSIPTHDKYAVLLGDTEATIKLEGTNQLGFKADTSTGNGWYAGCGIAAENCDLTITGSGSATIYDVYMGVYAKSITFDKDFTGTLTVNDYGGPTCCLYAAEDITIANGTLNLTSEDSNGIRATNVTISGGTVNADGGEAGICAETYDGEGDAAVNISGGTVNVVGKTYGIYAITSDSESDAAVNISGGTVTATGGYGGIRGDAEGGVNGIVNITGGTVTAVGSGSYSGGICAIGGDDDIDCSFITISGKSTVVKAKGDETAFMADVFQFDEMVVSGATETYTDGMDELTNAAGSEFVTIVSSTPEPSPEPTPDEPTPAPAPEPTPDEPTPAPTPDEPTPDAPAKPAVETGDSGVVLYLALACSAMLGGALLLGKRREA